VSTELVASDRAPGLFAEAGVVIPEDTAIAPHVTIYAGVELGRGVSVEQGAIVGRPQQIYARSSAPDTPEREATVIGDGCRIGSHTVVVAGARMGPGAYLSDYVSVREATMVGDDAMIGRGCALGHHTRIGARTRIFNDTIVAPWTVIEEDVLIGPRVTIISDPTMGRRPAGALTVDMLVRRASRIGACAILIPPLEIGEEAVVGAAAMVRDDVPARTVVAGSPARHLRAVREDELL
jgi:UDP-2-acetamido-3-amino-2,3-dideoxy-glucuronate N-acetyltransferase